MMQIANRPLLFPVLLLLCACTPNSAEPNGGTEPAEGPASTDASATEVEDGQAETASGPYERTGEDYAVTRIENLHPRVVAEYAAKYDGYTKEELRTTYQSLEEGLTLEKVAELNARHEAGIKIPADRDPVTGAPVRPKAMPFGVFFQSRTRSVVGQPESEKEAWFIFLPFDEFPHLYRIREELVWLKGKMGRPKDAPPKRP